MKTGDSFEEDPLALPTQTNDEDSKRSPESTEQHENARTVETTAKKRKPIKIFVKVLRSDSQKSQNQNQGLQRKCNKNKPTTPTSTTTTTTPAPSKLIILCEYCKPKNIILSTAQAHKLHLVRCHSEHFFPEERRKATEAGITDEEFKRICTLLLPGKFENGKCKFCQKRIGHEKDDFVYFKWHLIFKHQEEVRKQMESAIEAKEKEIKAIQAKKIKLETIRATPSAPAPSSRERERGVECLCGIKLLSLELLSVHSKSCSKTNFKLPWNPNPGEGEINGRFNQNKTDTEKIAYLPKKQYKRRKTGWVRESAYKLYPCNQCQRLMTLKEMPKHKEKYCKNRLENVVKLDMDQEEKDQDLLEPDVVLGI